MEEGLDRRVEIVGMKRRRRVLNPLLADMDDLEFEGRNTALFFKPGFMEERP